MMAVAKWQAASGDWIGPRNFHPPKRADLRYWYKSAQAGLHTIPPWGESYRLNATVDERTIIFELGSGTLYISRKEWL